MTSIKVCGNDTFVELMKIFLAGIDIIRPARIYLKRRYFRGDSSNSGHANQVFHIKNCNVTKWTDTIQIGKPEQGIPNREEQAATPDAASLYPEIKNRRSIHETRFDATHSPFHCVSLSRLQLCWQLPTSVSRLRLACADGAGKHS
jgi:hypothetical protein